MLVVSQCKILYFWSTKYLSRVYNFGSVVVLNISVWVKNSLQSLQCWQCCSVKYLSFWLTKYLQSLQCWQYCKAKIFYFWSTKYLCRAYNIGIVELKSFIFGKKISLQSLKCWQCCRAEIFYFLSKKYLCRAYNVSIVVEMKYLICVQQNNSKEPTMLVILQSSNLLFMVKIISVDCRACNVGSVVV